MSIRNRRKRSRGKQLLRTRSLRKRRRCMGFEPLEDRRLLTISTPMLGASNAVVFNGDAGVDSIQLSVSGGGLLQHNRGGSFGFNSNLDLDSGTPGDQTRLISEITSLSYNDSGANDAVSFGGSNVLALASASLSVSANTINIDSGSSVTSGDGAISLIASRSIVLSDGASLTTVDGGITLSANASGTATGGFVGLEADNATIQTTGAGNVSLIGAGGDDASRGSHYGVYLFSTSLTSTSTGENAGTITIEGVGGDGTSANFGVRLSGVGTAITSVDGAISRSGQGGNGSFDDNIEIYLVDVETISSAGTGPSAATITIDGNGGNGTSYNDGVYVRGTSTVITSVDGDILVTGQGTNASGVRLTHGGTSPSGYRIHNS